MATIEEALIYENSIMLWLRDTHNSRFSFSIPCATRSDRADMEDRLLSVGVKVTHA